MGVRTATSGMDTVEVKKKERHIKSSGESIISKIKVFMQMKLKRVTKKLIKLTYGRDRYMTGKVAVNEPTGIREMLKLSLPLSNAAAAAIRKEYHDFI